MGFFGKKDHHIRVAIDVSPHAIRGLVFVPERESLKVVRKMIFKAPEKIPVEKIGGKLHEFVFELIKSLERVPEKITLGVGPELGSHEMLSWKLEKPEGFRLASPKHLEPYFASLFEQYGASHHGALAYPLEVLANGYSLDKFFHGAEPRSVPFRDLTKHVVELEFRTLCLRFAENTGMSLFEMKKSLGGMPVELVPQVAAYESAITRGLGVKDAFLVSIGWEETMLLLVRNGVLAVLTSFPVGERHCVRGIAKKLAISTAEAEDLKRQEGELGVQSGTKVSEAMGPELEEWKKHFLECLGNFYTSGPLPAKVYVVGTGAHFPQFSEFLKTGEWIKDLSYVSVPEVQALEAQTLFAGNTFNGSLRGPEDFTLASLVFCSLHHNSLFSN